MSIHVARRRRAPASITSAFPSAQVIDVTSRATAPWIRLSPCYPHGGIPVPLSDGVTAQSVEGIWQALKVFEGADIDTGRLHITTMKGLKRTVRRYGRVLGHREGLFGERLLDYETARRRLYLPSYRWVLRHRVPDLVERLRELHETTDIVLLDHTTNGDVADLSGPLSHAALIRLFVTGQWPDESPTSGLSGGVETMNQPTAAREPGIAVESGIAVEPGITVGPAARQRRGTAAWAGWTA